MSFFNYDNLDLNTLANLGKQAEERQKAGGGKRDDLRWFNLKEGTHVIALCPPYNEKGAVVKSTFKHFGLGASGKENVWCPEFSYQERGWKCPMCQAQAMLAKLGVLKEDENFQYVNKRGPRLYYYFNVLVQTSVSINEAGQKVKEEFPILPHICQMSPTVGDFIIEKLQKYKSGLFKLESVILIEITRTGKTAQDTRYKTSLLPDRWEITDEGTLKAIAEQLKGMNLDVIFGKKWTEEEYTKNLAAANSLISHFGFDPPKRDDWDRMAPYTDEMRKASEKKKKDDSEGKAQPAAERAPAPADAPQGSVVAAPPVEPTIVVSEPQKPVTVGSIVQAVTEQATGRTVEAATKSIVQLLAEGPLGAAPQATEAPPAEPPASPAFQLRPASEAPPAAKEPAAAGKDGIVRDPTNIDPTTGTPRCFGENDGSPPCQSCPSYDMCLLENIKAKTRARKAAN